MLQFTRATLQAADNVERLAFACLAGLKPINNSSQNALWVRSPKTGKVITIGDGWWSQLRDKAPRLIGKIVHARANGGAVVMFTIDELRALAEIAATIAEKCKSLPPGRSLWGGWRRSFSRRSR